MTRSYVPNDVQNMIVGMRKVGLSLSEIGEILGRPKSTFKGLEEI